MSEVLCNLSGFGGTSGGGGGGFELADPTNISIVNADESAIISWTDPDDVTIDGQVLARWAGTLVIRKVGSAPTSKTDGTVVIDSKTKNTYSSTGYTDTYLTNNTTYYYGIFPYTTQGVYNFQSVTTFTPSAIYPTAVSNLAVFGNDESASITWSMPEDNTSIDILITADDESDRTFASATSPLTVTSLTNDVTYSVKAISHNAKGRTVETDEVTVTPTAIYPTAISDLSASGSNEGATIRWTTPDDATSVTITITSSGESDRTYANANSPLDVTGLTNETEYTVKATTYNAKGRYTDSSTITVTPNAIKIYGFVQNFADTNPDTCISYPSDVENANYDKMMTNEGTGTVTYGSWQNFLEQILKNKPYMVKANGEADYELSSSDYTKKADGVTASDVGNTSYSGAGAFAWLNKVYTRTLYRPNQNTRTVYFAIGGKPEVSEGSAGYDPDGFRDSDGNELEGVWIPMFYQNASNEKTIANVSYAKSLTTDQQRTKIQAVNSTRAKFLGLPIVHILRDLEYMLFKSTDIQKNAGHGNCNGGSESALKHNPIVANGSVVGWKGTSDKKTANKYFHSMVLGTYDQWLRDPYTQLRNGVLYVSENYKEDDLAQAIDLQGNVVSFTSSSSWTYPCSMTGLKNLVGGFYKQEDTGSQTTGSCDGQYFNASGTRVALRFGRCNYDLIAGPAALGLYCEASVANWSGGAAVLLLPPAGYAPA